ncbi:MAG: AAA family ATPase [Sinobacteraceae bacterium]|nr:AAA family ATPase [Nevskiaceae bacterium]
MTTPTPPHPAMASTSLPAALHGLLRPQAYPHPVGELRVVETHMSWVLLTGEYAYKIKRPVRFPFADFRDPAHRAHLCAEEVRLNRRFAPVLYLGVAAVRASDGIATFTGSGPIIETAVQMRQFDRGEELDILVRTGRIDAAELAYFGEMLAGIHETLPAPPADTDYGTPTAVARLLHRNLAELQTIANHGPSEAAALRHRLAQQLRRSRRALATRARGGHIRECHGDLHLSNLVRLDGRITPFDALEFEPAFRYIDTADEVAFVCADLEGHGRADLALTFLDAYLDRSGDYPLLRVLDLYLAHRALIRAKIMAIRASATTDTETTPVTAVQRWRRRESDYLAVAHRTLSRPPPRLLLLHGLSGSGKSWLARHLAPRLGAIHLRSDRERKRLAGIAPLATSGSAPGAGLYTDRASELTYAQLAAHTRDALGSGRSVLCDATFLDRTQRLAFRDLATACGATALLLHCTAPDAVLRERLRARRNAGSDISEADETVLAWQYEHAEAPTAEEGLTIHVIDTSSADPVELAWQALQPRRFEIPSPEG